MDIRESQAACPQDPVDTVCYALITTENGS